MAFLSRISLAVLLAFSVANGESKAQITWASLNFTLDSYTQFFWIDSTDSTLYVGANSLTELNGQPCRWGFCYKNGVASRLPFEDSITSFPMALCRYKGKLYVSADKFGTYDPVTGWHTIVSQSSTFAGISCIYPYGDKLLVSGLFQNLLGTGVGALALFDGTTFTDFHRADTIISFPNGGIRTMVSYKGNLVVAGNFDEPNGFKEIMQWNGQRWTTVGGGIGGGGMEGVSELVVVGNDLYVAGMFRESSGGPGNNIARWDGQQWHRLGEGIAPNSAVYDMIAVGDTLVVVGPFNKVNGQRASMYARYYNGRWCPNTDSFDNGAGCVINYYDTIFVGGGFWHINGQPIASMARVVSQSDCHSTLATSEPAPLQNGTFSVSPNPSTGLLRLRYRLDADGGEVLFRLTDPAGRCLLSRRLDPARQEATVNLDELPPGLYYYYCSQNGRPVASGKLLLMP